MSETMYGGGPQIWESQDPVDYINNTLVINTWEDVDTDLSKGKPTKLLYITVEQTNNGATAEDIELEITIDGTPHTWSLGAMVSGAIHSCGLTIEGVTVDQATNPRQTRALDDDHSAPLEVKKVGLIRERQTSVVDVVTAQIEVNIVWDKLVESTS